MKLPNEIKSTLTNCAMNDCHDCAYGKDTVKDSTFLNGLVTRDVIAYIRRLEMELILLNGRMP